MKFSAQEEYGLRCLLQIATGGSRPVTIKEISDNEGLTATNVAKLVHLLRKHEFIDSHRGQSGGYVLARPPEMIKLSDVINALGGPLYDEEFCERHSGSKVICTHSTSCALKGLWQKVQTAVDGVIGSLTLADLIFPSFAQRFAEQTVASGPGRERQDS